MARFVLAGSIALAASSSFASASCFAELEAIAKDAKTAGAAVKSLAKDCHGEDRTKCQADVTSLLTTLDSMQTTIASATTDCGSHGPECPAAIKQLGDDIGDIQAPAKEMADKCAGEDKSTITCVEDGFKVAAASVTVVQEVESVYKTCKTNFTDTQGMDAPDDLKCTVCQKAAGVVVEKGTHVCEEECAKAGKLQKICQMACDSVDQICEKLAKEDCADKVCQSLHLCPKPTAVNIEKPMECPAAPPAQCSQYGNCQCIDSGAFYFYKCGNLWCNNLCEGCHTRSITV